MKRKTVIAVLLAATILLCVGCGAKSGGSAGEIVDLGPLLDELVPLAGTPPMSDIPETVASRTAVRENASARIDYSNLQDGYVMAEWLAGGNARVKLVVKGPSGVSYQYNLKLTGGYEAFPLSDGNGTYVINIYQNVSGSKYAVILDLTVDVKLTDEYAPFLRPNQYVSFSKGSAAEKKASELCAGAETDLEKVKRIYVYVTDNVSYDYDKAKSVSSGYVPDVDETLTSGKGICFDFAALMTAMLRSQGVPTKLVVGYTADMYHAWISVFSDDVGWIEGTIYFDGKLWKLMDPTFASAGRTSKNVLDHISNEANYSAKYLY